MLYLAHNSQYQCHMAASCRYHLLSSLSCSVIFKQRRQTCTETTSRKMTRQKELEN